ncbi:NHLP family bacteriocin export ABC transporter peptidase/permease/ATPase subunit [Butyrivibrio sp. LC3010]|uniref:NHLP family bacteriocin export ABC transporter peptidase/permease/ATPase subunit n=1 Tax=Butyrivibrio sp. LC3010 TaxID=1280680 RepID=UPI0003F95EC5|nr:NHLP family bacteriocin export ABC transporter peptidase/permease/ATPase subunit [Butyrivibrio sp. LC3010]
MKKKIRKPIKNGVARVPVIMQMEALECGAACLCMVMAYYNMWIPLEQMRVDCGVSRDGSNAKYILTAARKYGFEAKGFRYEIDEIKEAGLFPCIIHWNFDHFVVLNGFRNGFAYINDPARGEVKITMDEFDNSFTGVCLRIIPGENFVPGGNKKSIIAYAAKRLKGAKKAILLVALTGIISYMIEVINPVMTRVFMDRLLTGINRSWLNPFIAIMVVLAVLQIISEFISKIYFLKINGKLASIGATTYMWKVLRLPIEFFSQRMAGDIIMREEVNEYIAATLVDTVAPLFLNTIMMLVYLVVMLRFSVGLTFIGILTIVINLLVASYISQKRINLTRVQMRDEGKLLSATISGIEMAETIKSSGAENGFFQKWAGYQASVQAQNVKYSTLDAYLGVIPPLLADIANYLVLTLGVFLTMRGDFTVGMIIAFQGFLSLFMQPANMLITSGQSILEMRTDMERVSDVMEYPEDDVFKEETIEDIEDGTFSKLTGAIEIKNLSFGYSRLKEPLIKDFSLSVKPGQRIALVGKSGCGKSTIAGLISGLYKPWSGDIRFDGKSINEIQTSVFKGSVAVAAQDIGLFEDTIENNIKMWDESIEDFEMILAARDAGIHEKIISRPSSYRSRLLEGGKDMSGGEKQRLEIARVLARDPSIIILDEATSALDAKTEYEVVKAIKNRGLTCIVVAHRLSTIRDCDDILVMDNGVVVERGTHEELMKLNGFYKDLVTVE